MSVIKYVYISYVPIVLCIYYNNICIMYIRSFVNAAKFVVRIHITIIIIICTLDYTGHIIYAYVRV